MAPDAGPNETDIILQADWLFHLERFRDAEMLLRKWLAARSSAQVQAVLSQAIARQTGRYEEALEEARHAIAQDPSDPAGYHVLAVILMDGDPKAALTALEKAIQLAPYRPDFHALQARIYLKMKQPKQALEAIETARHLAPQHPDCIQIHAVALLANGRAREAREVIDTGLRLDPGNAAVHNALGWIMLRVGETDLARLHFSEALRLKPRLETARSGLSQAFKTRYPLYRWFASCCEWQQEHLQLFKVLLIAPTAIIFILLLPHMLVKPGSLSDTRSPWSFVPILLIPTLVMLIPWLAIPFYDLLLRFDSLGQLSLTKDQVWLTNWIIALFICLVFGGLEYLISRSGINALAVFSAAAITAGFVIGLPGKIKYR